MIMMKIEEVGGPSAASDYLQIIEQEICEKWPITNFRTFV
jgi:hypothetical protein